MCTVARTAKICVHRKTDAASYHAHGPANLLTATTSFQASMCLHIERQLLLVAAAVRHGAAVHRHCASEAAAPPPRPAAAPATCSNSVESALWHSTYFARIVCVRNIMGTALLHAGLQKGLLCSTRAWSLNVPVALAQTLTKMPTARIAGWHTHEV